MAKRDELPGLGAKLTEARKAAGLTIVDAADKSDVHRVSIGEYEANRKTPTVAVLIKLAAAYSVSVADLLPSPDPVPLPPVARPMGKRK